MIRKVFLMVACLALFSGCASDFFVRARAEGTLDASAQVFSVASGTEIPVTERYYFKGKGTITVQSVLPFITADIDYDTNVMYAFGSDAAVSRDLAEGRVLIRRKGVQQVRVAQGFVSVPASEIPEPIYTATAK